MCGVAPLRTAILMKYSETFFSYETAEIAKVYGIIMHCTASYGITYLQNVLCLFFHQVGFQCGFLGYHFKVKD